MSFSVEFWDGYDFVFNTFTLHRRGLKDFIFMLSEKHDYEMEFARGMKKICDTNFGVTKMPTLHTGVMAFKTDLLNQYNYTVEFIHSLREEVIDPLKLLLNDQNNSGKLFNSEMRRIEKEFKDSADRLEKSRIKFHNYAKMAEDSKLQSELSKMNLFMSQDQKNKLEIKSQNYLKEAKDMERTYINNINLANNCRDVYIETMKRILNEFQNLEEKLIDSIKDALRKYIIYQVALIRNMQYDIERKAGIMESINASADIRSFIEKNATNSLPPYKFEFVPYSTEIDSRQNLEGNKYPKEVLQNVKNFITNVFYSEPPESEPDSIESKNFNEIETIVNLAWEGKKLPEEEMKIYMKFIKEKKYRRFFLNCLNKIRLSGLFTLDERSYFYIGELLNLCLDEIMLDKDYYSAKIIMNLAQTLYKTATEPNKPRVFLQSLIVDHPIWKGLEFWEELIKYNINEELHSQKNYNIYTFESQTEKNRRIKSIVVTQLISFSYSMLSYDISKEKVKDLILYFTKYHNIEEIKEKEIIKNLEDYSFVYERKNKEIDKIIENNEKNEVNNDKLKINDSNFLISPSLNTTEINESKVESITENQENQENKKNIENIENKENA